MMEVGLLHRRRWVVLLLAVGFALQARTSVAQDSDKDGLTDALEQRLLEQFAPRFEVGKAECAGLPAAFESGVMAPKPTEANGTIYGQAFLAKGGSAEHPTVELHFYQLWTRDCGAHGHALDTEHVATLVRASGNDLETAHWTALYWYAGAHENTVCDVSQIARAKTLHAEDRGAKVWLSPGKHAAFLNETLCLRGCGNDRCEQMQPMTIARIVNVGELAHPMNGSIWVHSTAWPLAEKMRASNFQEEPLARLQSLPDNEIAWFNPGRHPMQGVIAISSSTQQAIAGSGSNTSAALATAGTNTSSAIAVAEDNTGGALGTSYRKTMGALGKAVHGVGKALGVKDKPKD